MSISVTWRNCVSFHHNACLRHLYVPFVSFSSSLLSLVVFSLHFLFLLDSKIPNITVPFSEFLLNKSTCVRMTVKDHLSAKMLFFRGGDGSMIRPGVILRHASRIFASRSIALVSAEAVRVLMQI